MKSYTYIPAEAGFRVLTLALADAAGPALLTWARVLAWAISEDGSVTPVTLEGADASSLESCIVLPGMPMGACVAHGTSFTSVELWIDTRREALVRRSAESRVAGVSA